MGCSSGGAAALTMVGFNRTCFVDYRLLRTFVDQQDDDAAEESMIPLGAGISPGMKLIESTDRKPPIFTHVSEKG